MKHEIVNADCTEYLRHASRRWTTIFADPPDNIGTKYGAYKDSISKIEYCAAINQWLSFFVCNANTVWFSFNSRWMIYACDAINWLLEDYPTIEYKFCVQIFTFGQHNQYDLGNNFRPILRLRWPDAPLLPDAIRVPSWRQKNDDKCANPRGRIPGDVFDFPRVTGNSKQRRSWHPTQLNEGLVERCIRLTTPPGESVLDPFAGTGTTLRVCKRTGNPCTLIELDRNCCDKIAEEHGLVVTSGGMVEKAPSSLRDQREEKAT